MATEFDVVEGIDSPFEFRQLTLVEQCSLARVCPIPFRTTNNRWNRLAGHLLSASGNIPKTWVWKKSAISVQEAKLSALHLICHSLALSAESKRSVMAWMLSEMFESNT